VADCERPGMGMLLVHHCGQRTYGCPVGNFCQRPDFRVDYGHFHDPNVEAIQERMIPSISDCPAMMNTLQRIIFYRLEAGEIVETRKLILQK